MFDDGDEGQPGLQEATMDTLSNETPKNTENLLHKNFEYLLAQQTTTNNNTRHINHKIRKRVTKTGKF